jgi:4-amino-4-deoxy-L-arabinose transferase-like glycosyltransferase
MAIPTPYVVNIMARVEAAPVNSLAAPPATRPRGKAIRLTAATLGEAGWLWLAVTVFIAVTAWWVTVDNRVPIFDAGTHMNLAYDDGTALSAGRFWVPFETWNTYPPLVHLVGAVSYLLVGMHPAAMMIAGNLAFVPVLAFGCYGVGRLTAGPRAGLLAGVFALGTPMVVSMFHSFMVDTPQAAMVAISVWAILASERFARPGVATGAGALCGLAMLTKETSLVFVAGILLAAVARGGWRNWRGLLGFAVAALVIALPWYAYHWSDLKQEFTSIAQLYVNPLQSPPRFSIRSFGWYFWNLVNEQVGLPLAVAFVIGTVLAVARSARDRFSRDSLLPEILAGGLVSYLGMTYLTHKDPRYTLPALVYVAVLGTFWVPAVRRRGVRVVAAAIVVAFAVINFAGMSLGIGSSRRIAIALPGAQSNFLYTWQLTLYQDQGWLYGGPERDGDVPAFLAALRRSGVTGFSVDPGAGLVTDFNTFGFLPWADALGLAMTTTPVPAPTTVYLLLHTPAAGDPPPCTRLDSGYGVYAIRGVATGIDGATLRNPANPRQRYQFVCPRRPPVLWPPASG